MIATAKSIPDTLGMQAIEATVNPVVITDARQPGNPIIYVNPAFERYTGYSVDEAVGQNCRFLQKDDRDQPGLHTLRRAISKGEAASVTLRNYRKDGSLFWQELHISPVHDANGEVTHFMGFQDDITKRKRAEDALAESRAMLEQRVRERTEELRLRNEELRIAHAARLHVEEALRESQAEMLHVGRLSAMGEMATGLAHELNQPLTANMTAISTCRRLLAKKNGDIPSQIIELMDHAIAESNLAGQIIRSLREFVRNGDTNRTVENINTVVDEAIRLGSIGSRENAIEIERNFANSPPAVNINKIQIQQVILNLMRNATEAMARSNPKIMTLTTGRLDDGHVEVAVSDTGCGLDRDVAQRLFHHFVSTKSGGMGIGLSICQTIVDSHGCRIWAEPGAEGGTVFHFTVPVAEESCN